MTSVPRSSTRLAVGNTQPLSSAGLGGALDFDAVTKAATAYLDQTKKENDAAIAQDGIGLRYGEKSTYAKLSKPERYKYVQSIVRQKNPAKVLDDAYINRLMNRMRVTSCIGYTMESLAAGYAAAGESERWNEIAAYVHSKGTIGTVLATELQKDGWEAVYWNADTRTKTYRGPTATPQDVQRMKDHEFFKNKFVDRNGNFRPGVDADGKPIPRRDYYGVYPQHALLNFLVGPANSNPKPDQDVLAHMNGFYVGPVASGYHTIVGVGTEVRDSHVGRNPDDATNIERRPFYELTYAWDTAARARRATPEGNPVFSEEQSGILMIPPGTWVDEP